MADQVNEADTSKVNGTKSSLVGDNQDQVKVSPPPPPLPHDQNEEEAIVGKVRSVKDELNNLGEVTEIEVSGNAISLIVDVRGDTDKTTLNTKDLGKRSSLTPSKVEVRERNSREKKKKKNNGLENGEQVSAKVIDHLTVKVGTLREEEENKVMGNHEFSVGDLVWGKIKNQPWWPGQIYNHSDASESAIKYRSDEKSLLLVAYFGDRSYAWCHPSQLKPFQEKNFEEMLMQSKSRKFLDAVDEAVDEIGRNVVSVMTCSCVQMETQVGALKPLLALNPGIRQGVAVPSCVIDDFSITHFEPSKFLEVLRYFAFAISPISTLELKVFQQQVIAFKRSMGCGQMSINQLIPEDNTENAKMKNTDFNDEAGDLDSDAPKEDWISSPQICGYGNRSMGNTLKEISDDTLYYRIKERTMTDILGDNVDVEPEKCERDVAEEGTVGKRMLASRKTRGRKKRKRNEGETENCVPGQDDLSREDAEQWASSKKERKRKTDQMEEKEETNNSSDADFHDREENMGKSLSRERKKSKYLSPPYIDLSKGHKSWIMPCDDSAIETPNVPKDSRVGKTMRKAIDQLSKSPPIVKCSVIASNEKLSEESLKYPSSTQEKKIVLKLATEEIYNEFIVTALDTMYLNGNRSSRWVKDFLSIYRGSLYIEGSNYKRFKDFMTDQSDTLIEFSENTPPTLETIDHRTCQPASVDNKSEAKRTEGDEGEKMLNSSVLCRKNRGLVGSRD